MRLPWVPRHRLESAERELKYKAIALEAKDRELERKHEEIENLTALSEQLAGQTSTELARNEQLRKEYAGDLQLAHTRYDEFVRDMLEKILTRAAPAPAAGARSSSPQEEQLPDIIQSAIEEFSFGNPIVAEQLTAEAWRRVKRNEKHDEIAEKILAGETPD